LQSTLERAEAFAALGDQTRLALIAQLSGGQPRSITQLTEGSKLSRQAITKHLKVLESVGMVYSVPTGRTNMFAFDPAPLDEMRAYLDSVSRQWDDVLGRLKAFVEE